MTINLTPGITASVWISLRELAPIGYTGSFTFTFTNDITGIVKTATPTDLQPSNKWSRYNFIVSQPENLNAGVFNFQSGMWSYVVSANNQTLQTGKVFVEESKTWAVLQRPAKNTGALRR